MGQGSKLKILVAIDELPEQVWDAFAQRSEISFVRDGLSAYHSLKEHSFDLTFVDLYLVGMDSLALLRRIKEEQLCPAVVLTSETPSFSYAQQGILLGVCAYLLRPLQREELCSVMDQLNSEPTIEQKALAQSAAYLSQEIRNPAIKSLFLSEGEKLIDPSYHPVHRALVWKQLYEQTVEQVFQRCPWLELFYRQEDFARPDAIHDGDQRMIQNFCEEKLSALHEAVVCLLPPECNRQMEEILLYLLQNIDLNLQQIEVAQRFYVANSTISTRFQRHLGVSYRDYMTKLKIRRAQFLLLHTDIRTKDIADRLGYKDKDYFSRLFHQHTGITLQEYENRSSAGNYNI